MINYVAGCGGDDDPVAPPPPPDPGVLKIVVRSSTDSSPVPNSNVVLYQAENSEAVLRDLTDPDGTVYFNVDEGNYYLNTSAQGFNSAPVEGITPIPFFVAWEDTLEKEILLNDLENTESAGYVLGFVDPAINNFLILAELQSTHKYYSTVSGPDGFFILFNLPYGTYDLDALKAGYKMDDPVSAFISSGAEVDTVSIPVSQYQGSVLTGSVTFLAIENSTVDITLIDPETRAIIPGLSVMSDVTGLNYRIEDIPDGSYLAWASLQNDGYVIDPDWLFKNPGGLDVSFATSSTLELNFSVTGSITLVSPTNPADSTTAFMAESQVPVFKWLSGIPALQPGKIYQWRLWADKGTQADSFVEQLISSSEDLRGIFQVPENPTE
jgi:hypothetical protein